MTEAINVEQIDPEDMDLSDLTKLIEDREASEDPTAEEEEVEEVPTEESGEKEATEEEPAETETGKGEEETEEVQPTVEELQADLEQMTADMKHFESVSGRNAGEAGFLRQQLKKREGRITELEGAQRQQGGDELHDAEPPPRREPQMTAQESEADAKYAMDAMQFGAQMFTQEHPDSMVKDPTTGQQVFDPELTKAVEASGTDMSHVLESRDASFISQQTKATLESAYRKLQSARIAAGRAEKTESAHVDQAAKLKAKKRTSAAASGGGVSASTPLKYVTPADMSTDDLAKEIERRNL